MKDRLAEYRVLHQTVAPDFDPIVIDIPLSTHYWHLDEFLTQVDESKHLILRIREKTREMRKIQSAIISAPKIEKELKEEEKKVEEIIKKDCKRVNDFLREIDTSIKEKKVTPQTNSVEMRIKKVQLLSISTQLSQVMKVYSEAQSEYKEKCRAKILRQTAIAGKSVCSEEVERRVETGELIGFSHGICVQDHLVLGHTVLQLSEQQQELKRLEDSLQDVHEMFTDIMMLVMDQEDLIDHIESVVEDSYEFVEKSVDSTKRAFVYQSRARRKKLMMFCSCCAVVGVVVLVILLAVKVFSK